MSISHGIVASATYVLTFLCDKNTECLVHSGNRKIEVVTIHPEIGSSIWEMIGSTWRRSIYSLIIFDKAAHSELIRSIEVIWYTFFLNSHFMFPLQRSINQIHAPQQHISRINSIPWNTALPALSLQ
ncbi:hypothetical protein T11_2053 [Trichinella zimbabwensis]|uniref:Uncharacterized protein n=1 Tax=Trichinella zimbabwensis TaxID=268475 RepID=A0A0V1HBB5_9BILA|nr:hypothetical protein T11_2053 [Trichinella zimbabwensis]